ncbi:MAG: hypothetical protein RLW62_04535 [Gammaproteobacteria bacterium]
MKGLNARAQVMSLLTIARSAGAASAAIKIIEDAAAARAGKAAVDWNAALARLRVLVSTLPAAREKAHGHGIDLVEDEPDSDRAA